MKRFQSKDHMSLRESTLNNILIAPNEPDAGADLLFQIMKQDLAAIQIFRKSENNFTNLNGLTLIEPSDKLSSKIYQWSQEQKILNDFIYYIDPTNPNTQGINILNAPIRCAYPLLEMCIEEFMVAAPLIQRKQLDHIRKYFCLLKACNLHGEITIFDLIALYEDIELVCNLHKKLKTQIDDYKKLFQHQDEISIEEQFLYDIMIETDEWLDREIYFKLDSNNQVVVYTEGNYIGQPKHFERNEAIIQELRSALMDLSSNKFLQKTIFCKTDFDFSKHINHGGVLLVNTAYDELGELSNLLGRIILYHFGNISKKYADEKGLYHHILIDGIEHYYSSHISTLLRRSRVQQYINTFLTNTISALDKLQADLFLFRNVMVLGGITDSDATILSELIETEENLVNQEPNTFTTALSKDNNAERRKYLREQQRKIFSGGSSVLKEIASQKKTSNISYPELDKIFGDIEN
ncbi:hypothetical protein COO03_04545 [Bacillus sp. AFS098217]|uniref:hypothetical protein n=1 Tax=Bacillus sp. AFS098217 TaxID=2033868 RepID=UPI000BEE2D34|nr:hypothetical protein [Bacillus sp. AFS098217]PEB54520.1 hypothetical protein COO03_04545 [Bacillus sp. AFS098217]